MYCALDKIDLAAMVEGRQVAVQTDHRSADQIERALAARILFALTRVINARHETRAQLDIVAVHYVVAEPPPQLVEALTAAGAIVSPSAARLRDVAAPVFAESVVGEIADGCFRQLAHRAAAMVGTRDLAIALRMLEDQTLAAPPLKTDPAAYWRRVLELAALTGELLRAKFGSGARWVVTDRALVPFGFSLPLDPSGGGTSTTLFPTNRAQRVIEDGRDESLFTLLTAAEETVKRPASQARLMPSLRLRDGVELDELVWRSLLPESPRVELPVIVCGVDGESTFGMIRREALAKSPEDAWEEALANLAEEGIEIGELVDAQNEIEMLAVSGSFYAAEKLLDQALLRDLHAHLEAPVLLAATPARGGLLVTAQTEGSDARFAAAVRRHYDAAGNRAISPVVWIIEDGRISALVRGTALSRADTSGVRAETSPQLPGVQRRRK